MENNYDYDKIFNSKQLLKNYLSDYQLEYDDTDIIPNKITNNYITKLKMECKIDPYYNNKLAYIYYKRLYKDINVNKSTTKALELFQLASDKCNDSANINLGILYENCKDYNKASEYYLESYHRGQCKNNYLVMILKECILDYTKDIELEFINAVSNNHLIAKYNFALLRYNKLIESNISDVKQDWLQHMIRNIDMDLYDPIKNNINDALILSAYLNFKYLNDYNKGKELLTKANNNGCLVAKTILRFIN
jgi:TPR repeat protein